MSALQPDQLAQLKSALAKSLAALAGGATDGALPAAEREFSPADKATVRLLNDLAAEAAGQQQALVSQLRRALAKCDDGSYGECEECGAGIGFSRLQARPEARLCIACQTRAEKR